jgi:hypothetical protein
MESRVRPRGTDRASIARVIVTESIRGVGTEEDPCRKAYQYWSLSGKPLAEYDPVLDENRLSSSVI